MKKIELGDGKYAVGIEVSELRRGHVRRIHKLADEQGVDVANLGLSGWDTLLDAALTILTDSWDLEADGAPLPVTFDVVADLPDDVYDALQEGLEATVRKVLDMGEAPDPKSAPSSSQPAKPASSKSGPRSGSRSPGSTA